MKSARILESPTSVISVVVAARLVGCSSPEPVCYSTEVVAQRIVGGSDGSSLSSELASAVVAVFAVDAKEVTLCTGVVVSPTTVLTARHCVDQQPEVAVFVSSQADAVSPSSDCDPPATLLPAPRATPHATLDAMLLEIIEPIPDVEPLALAASTPSASEDSGFIVGFGLTENETAGSRRFITTTIVEVTESTITTNSGPTGGTCTGDSGAPLFAGQPDEEGQLIGILSVGSDLCRGRDDFINVAAVAEWAAQQLE